MDVRHLGHGLQSIRAANNSAPQVRIERRGNLFCHLQAADVQAMCRLQLRRRQAQVPEATGGSGGLR